MNKLLDVMKVKAKQGYRLELELEFENGERRMFNMAPLMDKKPFTRLKDTGAFFSPMSITAR